MIGIGDPFNSSGILMEIKLMKSLRKRKRRSQAGLSTGTEPGTECWTS